MSAKSYAESAKTLSNASTSSTAAASVNADYPPILSKPITTTMMNKSDLANKALAVVAANTLPSAPNVWTARSQNARREERERKDKEEDYDPFVVRRFDHHAPPPARLSTNENSAQAWPPISNKPIRDKAPVKWPPTSSSSPSSMNERGSSSSSEPRATKPVPGPVSNQPTSTAAPTPPSPPSQSVSSSTAASLSSSKTYTFGSIHLTSETRHKRAPTETQDKKQADAAWNMVAKKKGKKEKNAKADPEIQTNGKNTTNGVHDEPEPPAVQNGISSVPVVTGVPESVMASLPIMVPPNEEKSQPLKRPLSNGKSKPKGKVASANRVLVGGDEKEGIPSLQVNDAKWRFTVDTDDDLFVKGVDTPPIGSGTLSPLVMDHMLATLKSTQTSTPSFSPVVLSQTMGIQTPQSLSTPPVVTSPVPSPPSGHQLFAPNGTTQSDPAPAAPDDFEVKDFGYGFGGLDVETVKRSHEQRMAELERNQHERTQERERIGDEHSPHRTDDYSDGLMRGQRRGYGSRGYGDGRGRRGFGMNGRGGGRGMRYGRPFHDPTSPVSPSAEGVYPYAYPPPMPPYGYPMPYYPPGTYDYGAYYGYPPYMPPQQSPTAYSPSHYPPPFDMPYLPPPPPHLAQPSQPMPVPITRPPYPLDPLRYHLLGQVEYYLSPDNVVHDFFLRQQMDSKGFVPISLIASFNRAQRLTTSIELVKEVLLLSSIAEVYGDHVRMKSWEQWVLPGAAPSTVDTGSDNEGQGGPVQPEETGEENNDKNHGQSD